MSTTVSTPKINSKSYELPTGKFPLHLAQQEVFYDQITDLGNPSYNIGGYVCLKGKLNKQALLKAAKSFSKVFDVYNFQFDLNAESPQLELANKPVDIEVKELDFSSEKEPEKAAIKWMQNQFDQVFDLANNKFFEHYLIQLDAEEHYWFLRYHHLLMDGYGISINLQYLAEKYLQLTQASSTDSEIEFSFPAYTAEIASSIEYLESEGYEKDKNYWLEQFKSLPEPLLEKYYQGKKELENNHITVEIPQIQQEKFNELSKTTGVSLQQLLLAALTLYFGRTQHRKEVVFGIPIHNRRNKKQRGIAGMFSRFIPFKGSFDAEETVADFIQNIKRQQRMDYRYQAYPISHLNRELKLLAQGRNQLFDIVINYATLDLELPFGDLKSESRHLSSRQGNDTPITFWWCAYSDSQSLELKVNFQSDYFTREETNLLIERMLFILEQFHSNTAQQLHDVQILLDTEKELLLGQKPNNKGVWFNEKEVDLDNNKAINVRFEEIVAANKEAIAIIWGSEKWRYDKLNKFSNQIANSLSTLGVKAGDLVGVHLQRNPMLISSLLGILKCGAVYVPLDTQNPTERIEKMIENGKLQAMITNEPLLAALQEVEVSNILLLDSCSLEFKLKYQQTNTQIQDIDDVKTCSTANPTNLNEIDSWAYMLYTSGSTGQPKGAITRHDGAFNHILAEYDLLELEDGFRFLQSAGIGSDISVFQILAPLLKGGAAVIINKYELLDYNFTLNKIDSEEVSIIEAVPSYLRGLVNWVKDQSILPKLNQLQWIMMVGEEVPVKLVNEWKSLYPHIRILNGYGPCEASDDITQYEVKALLEEGQKRVPIGRPLTNMNIFVTEPNGSLCPIGVPGELCVTGVGVGAGYWRMPEKTATSFIKNPFEGTLGDILYKTGDLARWLPDGNLEFLGRIDRQLKIRGNRVELGEIEAFLREEPVVEEARVVVHKNGDNNESLIAFAVLNEGLEEEEAKQALSNSSSKHDAQEKIELNEEEREQLLFGFNQTASDYDTSKTILDLFRNRVEEGPDNVAVIFKDQELSYKALDEQSNQLAQHLRKKGLKEESFVAICVDRSLDMIISTLAVLKAGGVYVPIDPEYPQERISYLVGDANAKYVICHQAYLSLFEHSNQINSIILERDLDQINQESTEPVINNLKSENLAYVYYTSGSTGRPKGVMIEHRSLYNMALAWLQEYHLNTQTSMLQVAGFSFDVFVGDFCRALLSGGKMIICDPDTLLDFDKLYKLMAKYRVNLLECTPTLGISLLEYTYENQLDLSWMDLLIVGSDKCPAEGFRQMIEHYGQEFRIINSYGTTETTIDSSYYENTDLASLSSLNYIPIGKPLQNYKYYVLDTDLNVVPIGVEGEIYIGGHGLARGYLNKPGLTRERFIPNPFCEGERMYRTGDIGMWLSDGNLQCQGRMDDQVKIGGNRIELGEIETVLQKHESIHKCIVLAKAYANGNNKLVAYVVPNEGFKQDMIFNYLMSQLPKYMVPFLILELEELPLTPNGKIDKKALLKLDAAEKIKKRLNARCQEGLPAFMQPTHYCIIDEIPLNLSDKVDEKALLKMYYELDQKELLLEKDNWIAPRNETEETLVQLWKELLKVNSVSVEDNFFQLGGHSLFATRLVSAIKQELQVEIAIKDIFTQPTIASLAKHIQAQDKIESERLKPNTRPALLPLSFAQERLWFIHKLQGSTHYHMPAKMRISGDLQAENLENSFKEIVNRHEVLRTVIKEQGVCYQEILPKNQWSLKKTKLDTNEANIVDEYVDACIRRPFNLSEEHMLRAELLEHSTGEYTLVLVMHHIASDGWSVGLFMDELFELYNAQLEGRTPNLEAIEVHYSDYALWQRKPEEQEKIKNKLSYWEAKLEDVTPLQLPTDFARPSVQSTNGNQKKFNLSEDLTSNLSQLANEEGVTLFMLLLTAFKVLLYRYSGQEDICVGSPIANRTQKEIEPLIGFFVNTLALRSNLSDNPTFRELLTSVKNTTLEAYSNQEVPFEQIVEKVEKDRDRSRSPLFQVVFALQNTPDRPELKFEKATSDFQVLEMNSAKFDLTFIVRESDAQLHIDVEFCTDLFLPETIDYLASHFEVLLRAVVENRNAAIDSLEMMNLDEKAIILDTFNNTQSAYDKELNLVSLFEQQVERFPNKPALVFQEQSLSFTALDQLSNQIANCLIEQGIGKGENVGILTYRGFEMIAAMLGTIKAGAVYIPLNTKFPTDRIDQILTDAGAKYVLTNHDELNVGVELPNYNFIDVRTLDSYADTKPNITHHQSDPTYLMYTSGTTGEPKGILVNQQNIIKLIFEKGPMAIYAKDKVLQWANYAFDGSVYEIYCSLFKGATLHLIEEDEVADTVSIGQHLQKHQISVCFLTTSFFNAMTELNLESMKDLRSMVFGGEKASPVHVNKAFELLGPGKLINGYGPTETTVFATYYAVDQFLEGRIPIGGPLSNTRIYITGKDQNLAGIGMVGELWIEGDNVALEYLNKPEISAKKFIRNPFDQSRLSRIYRTGDLARWLPSGEIAFVGRMDTQVKVRGYRIELGEIEKQIQQYDYVGQNVVLTQQDAAGTNQLVAFVVPKPGYEETLLLAHLETQLPSYMIPALIIELEALPLNASGKINKKALPKPDLTSLNTKEYVAPRNQTEEKLAEMWKTLLDLENIGVYDNFFELGGHSLLATRLVSSIRQEFSVNIPLGDLFQYTCIDDLAKYIQALGVQEEECETEYEVLDF